MGQPLYEVSRKYHFTFIFDSVLCNWGEFFTNNYIFVTRAAFRRNFWSAGNYPNPDPDPWNLNPKADCRALYYCVKFQVIPIRGFRFIVLTYTHAYAPTHIIATHIVTKWSQYPRHRTTSSARIVIRSQKTVGLTSDSRNALAKFVPSADDNSPVACVVFDDHGAFAETEVECWTLAAMFQLKQ